MPVYDTEARPYAELLEELEAENRAAIPDAPVPEKPKKAPPRMSIQQRMKEQVGEYIAQIEDELDKFTLGGYKTTFELYGWLASENVKSPQAAKIADYYKPLLAELEETKCKSDPQLCLLYTSPSPRDATISR